MIFANTILVRIPERIFRNISDRILERVDKEFFGAFHVCILCGFPEGALKDFLKKSVKGLLEESL